MLTQQPLFGRENLKTIHDTDIVTQTDTQH